MTTVHELSRRANRAIDAVGSVHAIAVLRIALGPITLIHLQPFLDDIGYAYREESENPAYRLFLR